MRMLDIAMNRSRALQYPLVTLTFALLVVGIVFVCNMVARMGVCSMVAVLLWALCLGLG